MIYLNAASHGLPDAAVNRRIVRHLELEARVAEPAAMAQVEEEFGNVRVKAATLLGADPEQVGFSDSTLSAWRAYVGALGLAGKRVLVAPHEWGDNIRYLRALGAQVEALPELDFAALDLSGWREAMQGDLAAVFLPMVSSIAGLRYPVEAIARLDRHGAPLIIDAAQAIGQVPVDVAQLGCDALFATTRKWVRGPRQTAVFWLSDPSRIDALDPGTHHVGLRLGLGVALDQVLARSVPGIQHDLTERATLVRKKAKALRLAVHSPIEAATGAVTLAIPERSANRIEKALQGAGCVVKWPNPAMDEPFSALGAPETKPLRIAPHVSNTPSELGVAFDAIAGAL